MCQFEVVQNFEGEVIYFWDEEQKKALDARLELFSAGDRFEASVFDTDGEAVSIQFPNGAVLVALPVDYAVVVAACGTCEDSKHPDRSRSGPLGAVPRWSAERHATEALLLEIESEFWRNAP